MSAGRRAWVGQEFFWLSAAALSAYAHLRSHLAIAALLGEELPYHAGIPPFSINFFKNPIPRGLTEVEPPRGQAQSRDKRLAALIV